MIDLHRVKTVYLDHNATTPIHADVKAQVGAWMEGLGEIPARFISPVVAPKLYCVKRGKTSRPYLGVEPLELIFTGGGSEANNLALKGICERGVLTARTRDQIIISSIEHPSVTKTAEYLRTPRFFGRYRAGEPRRRTRS